MRLTKDQRNEARIQLSTELLLTPSGVTLGRLLDDIDALESEKAASVAAALTAAADEAFAVIHKEHPGSSASNIAYEHIIALIDQPSSAVLDRVVAERVAEALREVAPIVEFYLKREIESPANHQEFARQAQEKLDRFRAAAKDQNR